MSTRKQILEGAETALNGATAAGSRVFRNRFLNLQIAELPLILLHYGEEVVKDYLGTNPVHTERDLVFSVEIVSSGENAFDDADNITGEVETIFHSNQRLGGVCDDLRLERVSFAQNDSGEKPLASAVMTWRAPFRNKN